MSAILENGVGGLIGNVAFAVVTQVLSRIKHEIELARHHKQDLEELEKQLNELNELLKGSAKSLQPNNKLLIAWLKKVNNAAYDADNLLDDCSYESFKHGSRTRKRDKSKSVFSKPFHCHVNSHRVKNLTNTIKTIYADAKKLGVVPIDVAAGHSYDSGSSSKIQGKTLRDRREWVDNQGLLVGRNQDITQLAELLCDSKNKCKDPTVIGIVGLPGTQTINLLVVKLIEVQQPLVFGNKYLISNYGFQL